MAERQLGRDEFDGIYREFYQQNVGKPTSVAQQFDFLAEKTGLDFKAFFQSWGNLKGVPNPDQTTCALFVRPQE